jgi:hypothetical protein
MTSDKQLLENVVKNMLDQRKTEVQRVFCFLFYEKSFSDAKIKMHLVLNFIFI